MLKKFVLVSLCLAVMLCIFGCGEPEVEKPVELTLSELTTLKIFQDIPMIDGERIVALDSDDYGNKDYVMVLQGLMKPDYDAYLEKLLASGFTKYADNGTTGVGNSILCATLQRGDLTLTLSYYPAVMRLYLAVSEEKTVSPRLIYNDSYAAENVEGAQNVLTMHQLLTGGNSYILQLKNGHFIINDGGDKGEYEALVAYLESLTPEGEKPYIEAWFISHAHSDHMGFFQDVNVANAGRVIVEGFYYNEVGSSVQKLLGTNNMVPVATAGMQYFSAADNKTTPVYRTHAGERYYFSDITIEIVYTNEQIRAVEYEGNYNASCTWLMFNIDGQKFLNAADAEIVNMRHVDDMMDKDYMDVDVMNVHHHGGNLYLDNVGYYQCETLLYAGIDTYSVYWVPEGTQEAALELQDNHCEEYVCYVDGSVVLTFPYTVGTYEILPTRDAEWTKGYKDRHDQWMAEIGRQ